MRRAFLLVTVAALLIGAAPRGDAATPGAPECNGHADLCERSLGDVAFATTHNSMASSADGFRPPNQRRTIAAQLEHGIRGFQIDAYFGTPRNGRVYTDLSGPLGKATELPPHLVSVARVLRRRLGAPPRETPYDVYLCHVFCELGAVPMLDEMRTMRAFLDAHPREVLAIVIEDYVPPARLATVMQEAGLGPMLLQADPKASLPTLGAMIAAGTRVLVTLEHGDGSPTMPNAFAGEVQETPFTFTRPRNLEAASSCAKNRGLPDSPVFQFNHWVTPAEPFTAARVNSSILRERIARCTTDRGRAPTLVAVDFAERGDLLRVVDAMNS